MNTLAQMKMNLLAQFQQHFGGGSWGIGEILIAIIVIAACIGIMFVAIKVFGVTIPQWAIQIFWIVVVAACAILAIRFVLSM
jgi:hypothetical protein